MNDGDMAPAGYDGRDGLGVCARHHNAIGCLENPR